MCFSSPLHYFPLGVEGMKFLLWLGEVNIFGHRVSKLEVQVVSGLHIVTMLVNVFKEFLRAKKRNCIHIKCKMMGFGCLSKVARNTSYQMPRRKREWKGYGYSLCLEREKILHE